MQKEIKHSWFFEQPQATVWEYLTDAALLSQWLMENDIKPMVGHKFTFTTRPIPNFDFDGIIHCEVLEIIPHRQIVYSWKGGPGNGVINLDTVVKWTLEPKDNGTELTLLHSGFKPENNATYIIMNEGWGNHIKERLEKLINKTS